ncbi:hypothetical protein L0Y81_04925 [Burkholderia multivorans]|uniref:hypothetical protein n=1 Tax=Burkholderia multivorans TaxID=87883 RepID=UPI001F3493E3|nr:hypothetical protein [Burkholderia multivorans]MCL4642696.1 hypothetical protein [Burkholderia multivorans]UQN86819.1 hypothetical protein L0Y85_04855 [Burkholderia multivorans]UQO72009.1 hypothetical protein L0Y81_04925 [Burkholderia multivorans]UQP26269.1 hypothetical protein L0Y89_05645 [Burkholderia multivorans]UQP37773.1 hypothetical protein L0Z03_05585 [Burkholderia multivorans]
MPIENIVAAAELSAVTDPVGNCMGLSCAHGARRVIIRARSGAAQRRGRASSLPSTIRHTKRVARRVGNAASLPAVARGFFAPVRA